MLDPRLFCAGFAFACVCPSAIPRPGPSSGRVDRSANGGSLPDGGDAGLAGLFARAAREQSSRSPRSAPARTGDLAETLPRLLAGDVLHGVFDLLCTLFEVALGLVAFALGLKLRVVSDLTRGFLGFALVLLGLVVDLVSGSHREGLPVIGRYPKEPNLSLVGG